jgi:multidrug efflux system membrane fusion protein
VGLRLIDPGNYVTAADATGLVVITQIQPISVIFTLAEDTLPAILARLHAGAQLKVEAWDREMKTKIAQGQLATMDNQIDPTTGTFKMRANFDNREGSLFPNQFVNARLLVEEKQGVTLIPTATVQRNSQITYVYLVVPPTSPKRDMTVTVRNITVGTSEGDDSEVTSGLSPGDQVVMTGVDKLMEGSKIKAPKSGERSTRGSS